MHFGCCSTFGRRKEALACDLYFLRFPKVSQHPAFMDDATLHRKSDLVLPNIYQSLYFPSYSYIILLYHISTINVSETNKKIKDLFISLETAHSTSVYACRLATSRVHGRRYHMHGKAFGIP